MISYDQQGHYPIRTIFDMWSEHLRRISQREKENLMKRFIFTEKKKFGNPAKLTQHNAFLTQTHHFLLGNFNTYRIWNLISLFELCLLKHCTKCRLWNSAFKGNHFECIICISPQRRGFPSSSDACSFPKWWNLMRNRSLLNHFIP